MPARRIVRVAPSFFDRLDNLLPEERTADGTPSTADFLRHELPPIMDRLAEDYDAVTLAIPGVSDVRVLVATGRLIPRLSIYTTVTDDGTVEIIHLNIDS